MRSLLYLRYRFHHIALDNLAFFDLLLLLKLVAMTQSELDYLQNRINEHFEREDLIMKEMLQADLSREEWIKLQNFIKDHSHSRFVRYVRRYNN